MVEATGYVLFLLGIVLLYAAIFRGSGDHILAITSTTATTLIVVGFDLFTT